MCASKQFLDSTPRVQLRQPQDASMQHESMTDPPLELLKSKDIPLFAVMVWEELGVEVMYFSISYVF